MPIQVENIDEIYEWDTETLWQVINQLEEDEIEEETEKELRKIKYGYDIMIPILYINKKWYTEHPTSKRVSVQGHTKYDIQAFYDEIDKRNKEMRRIILENLPESDMEPRV